MQAQAPKMVHGESHDKLVLEQTKTQMQIFRKHGIPQRNADDEEVNKETTL